MNRKKRGCARRLGNRLANEGSPKILDFAYLKIDFLKENRYFFAKNLKISPPKMKIFLTSREVHLKISFRPPLVAEKNFRFWSMFTLGKSKKKKKKKKIQKRGGNGKKNIKGKNKNRFSLRKSIFRQSKSKKFSASPKIFWLPSVARVTSLF